ncbi:alpha,alpha-trehalase TreF [Salinicola halophilus]|uniref:alpha,alpha-trehalase TreF n=1 Tax=Salinicola halophilus TaxID=184065 RepID=UPI000DA264E0|nr:alpha,alpha-trehalase TreF [Salinicola halophilus]
MPTGLQADHEADERILDAAVTPHDRFGELFETVALAHLFEDSKTFADSVPKRSPTHIMAAFEAARHEPDFDLRAFVDEYFDDDPLQCTGYEAGPKEDIAKHIDQLWPALTRNSRQHPLWSSLLSLSHDYVVPGGRFREFYYWDSYFTMLGLAASGEDALLCSVTDNCADLISRYGHMPNGNRSYYLSRSQLPMFSMMVALLEQSGQRRAIDYLPQLKREYAFWMDGEADLAPGECYRRCVRLDADSLLNRHWDDRNTPREESYREDYELAQETDRPSHELYRDLRAGAESGWDFSGRWLDDTQDLKTIRTTAFIPIELNAMLYHLEFILAKLCKANDEGEEAEVFSDRAERRREAVDRYLWCEERGAYYDYDWQRGERSIHLTAACVAPLYLQLASKHQAERVVNIVVQRLLAPGGLVTTEINDSHQQWDHPNGWAPLQWMAIEGFRHYGFDEAAEDLADRWLKLVDDLYQREHKLVEKYVLYPGAELAGGGEYPLQDGFGWTNGVTRALLAQRQGMTVG